MKLNVMPDVVAGTNRGGEDLFLVFTISAPTMPAELGSFSKPEIEMEGFDVVETLKPQDTHYRVSTEYDFSWEGTVDDAWDLVKDAIKDMTFSV